GDDLSDDQGVLGEPGQPQGPDSGAEEHHFGERAPGSELAAASGSDALLPRGGTRNPEGAGAELRRRWRGRSPRNGNDGQPLRPRTAKTAIEEVRERDRSRGASQWRVPSCQSTKR